MRSIVITQYRSTVDMLAGASEPRTEELLFVVEEVRLERYVQRASFAAVQGRFRNRATWEKVGPLTSDDLLVVHLREERRLLALLKFLAEIRNGAPALVFHTRALDDPRLDPEKWRFCQFLPIGEHFRSTFDTQKRIARNKEKLVALERTMEGAKNLLILLQDDPDPDSIASGLALRHVLGRRRSSTPLASFGRVTRPENLAMTRLLDIQIEQELDAARLADFDRIAIVDAQPHRFHATLPRLDILIDHHPDVSGAEAVFRDLRTSYGATSTILTEYLRATTTKVSERLATALLYGVRTDTLLLGRDVAQADVDAFTYLYPLANISCIRKIDRPELPLAVIDSFAEGLKQRWVVDKVVFSHLGRVDREDVIPQLADFCLQVEGVEWSVVSGVYEGSLVMSVRNVGFVRAAGELLRETFGDLGAAGGHRSMAKAIIPLDRFPGDGTDIDPKDVKHMQKTFLKALRGPKEAETASG
jgi:nanoRNase/pAp phosphatase (c-di-AMP/oligoRNAs hydrolase)